MIYIVIVLYRLKLKDSIAFKSLEKHSDRLNSLGARILIYNNSPEIEVGESELCKVINSKGNNKLLGAYSYALQDATKHGYDWLLLLDQDTELTREYFDELNIFLSKSEVKEYDVAVPVLFSKHHHLSPIACRKDIGPFVATKNIKSQSDIDKKIDNYFIVAYNSVSLISIETLNKIGGFGSEYKLDMLDYYYYYRLSKINSKVYILPVSLNQNLSLLEDSSFMSIERYRDYLSSRLNFAHQIGTQSVLFYKINLLIELLFHIRKCHSFKYIKLLIKYFFKW